MTAGPGAPTTLVTDLVIPAFNERENIPALFDAIEPVRAHLRHIVLADNNSTDGTGDLARERGAIVVHEPQTGYGAACLRALGWIAEQPDGPDCVAFLDADLADDPAALPLVLAPFDADDMSLVIGSRVRDAEPGALNMVQRFGNGLACALMRLMTGARYSDLGPLRAVRWDDLQRMRMDDRTWGWTVQMQMRAARLGMTVTEVHVPYRRRHLGKSKISGTVRGVFKAGTKIITTIFAERFRRLD